MLTAGVKRWLSLVDVTLFPTLILWFIWQLQFTARWSWIFFAVWIAASFFLHGDTLRTFGWRADNLWPALRLAIPFFGLMAIGLIVLGLLLGAPRYIPLSLFSWRRFGGYFVFCLLQQVALNSVVHNRMLDLPSNEWLAAGLTGLIFAACHWPNLVLVPLTFICGSVMAWTFGRARNIIPLAVGQAALGTLVAWAFPSAWIHHLRVGPGYSHFRL